MISGTLASTYRGSKTIDFLLSDTQGGVLRFLKVSVWEGTRTSEFHKRTSLELVLWFAVILYTQEARGVGEADESEIAT